MPHFYSLLDHPKVHNFVQTLLSFGRTAMMSSIKNHIRPAAEDWLLDFGCGPGRYASLFHCRYIGVDLSFAYVSHASRTRSPSEYFLQAAMPLSFKSESMDHILCAGVLHHLSDNQCRELLSEFKRVLKSGAKAFIFEPVYPEQSLNLIGRIIFALDRGRHQRSVAELQSLMRSCDFSPSANPISPRDSFPHEQRIFAYEKSEKSVLCAG